LGGKLLGKGERLERNFLKKSASGGLKPFWKKVLRIPKTFKQ
jgi:hypothetical protein